jgi:hypothetical protein
MAAPMMMTLINVTQVKDKTLRPFGADVAARVGAL